MTNALFDAVTRQIDAFALLLTIEQPADMAALGRQRVELARAANAFLAGEREDAGDPLQRLVTTMPAGEQRRMYLAFAELRMRYSAHIAKWDNRSAAGAWSAYREDCLSLVNAMRALLKEKVRMTTAMAA